MAEKSLSLLAAVTAMNAALNTDGVASMDVIPIEMLNLQLLEYVQDTKGILFNEDNSNLTIDVFIKVVYGSKIPETAWNVQENIKKEVEKSTGINVERVNIHIQGIDFKIPSEENR